MGENNTCLHTVELTPEERSWYIYIIVSCVIYVTGLFGILVGRIFWKAVKRWKFLKEDASDSRKPMEEYKAWYLQLKEFAVNLDTGKNMPGRMLVR